MLVDDKTVGKKLEDCAHFLSQCLKAGGLNIKEQWSVPMLINELTAGEDHRIRPTAKTLCEKVSRQAAQSIIDAGLLNIGDMIGYFAPAAKPGERSEYSHSGMFCGTSDNGIGSVTCHTASRFIGLTPPDLKDDWFLVNPNYSFTLLHIPRASESTAAIGAEHCRLVARCPGNQAVFYFVQADGRAVRTNRAPTDAKGPPALGAGDSRGYWFEKHGKVTICWRADGSLFTMDLLAGSKPSHVTIDGAPAIATRPGGLRLDI